MSLVSVCIPTYNAARHIGETIQSVLDSAYSNLEVIVNDDASDDGTREVVERLNDPRLRFFQNQTRLGVPTNWNRAVQKAKGKYVGLLNHDDLYGPFWLTFAVHVLEKHTHVGWVASAFRLVDECGETLDVKSRLPETREYGRSEAFLCVAQMSGLSPGYIARRQILEVVGYYDERAGFSADNDLMLRLAARYPLYYSATPHLAWRTHSSNLSRQWQLVEQTAECLRQLHKVFSDDATPEELHQHKKACYTHLYRLVLLRSLKLLERGDLETARRDLHLLHTSGYRPQP